MGMPRGAWERTQGLKTWAEGCAAKPACAGWGWERVGGVYVAVGEWQGYADRQIKT